MNRELETLAQSPPTGPKKDILTSPENSTLSASSQSSSNTIPSSSLNVLPANSTLLAVGPQLLKQVRLASGVGTDFPLPYDRPPTDDSAHTRHPALPPDIYWSATASTKEEEPRFHGQSSGEILLRDAKEFKQEFVDLVMDTYKESSSEAASDGSST